MRLVRLLAGTLVSSALFSSSTTMAFPTSDSVKSFYSNSPDAAYALAKRFRRVVAGVFPLLTCLINNDVSGNDCDSEYDSIFKEGQYRDFGNLPFTLHKRKSGNFTVTKFNDVDLTEKPRSLMVFKCVSSGKGVRYELNGVGEYGDGPKDGYKEIRALADYLVQNYFDKFYYNELKSALERDLFFDILADMLDNCTDIYDADRDLLFLDTLYD